ncbi:conserved unknown protein [Ectocarpus siliculosus]|uniref:Uncharacterized protein n=1 Tax=Ectocarpus siliculosus TaxID=2880 RepID=D8LC75_ECTSI|nr:conserved unknown protein [Ectocarpus siliculosus]|eukprot:CBN79258.1 conserved unknown protein [Ectocarpus siliculosus]
MGRYTTVQAYSDNNPKLVHVSYDQAKGKDNDEGKAGGKLVVEKTDQVMGSCAGAGSGEFHTYRAHRRREMHRVAAMDEEAQVAEATAKLHEAIEKGKNECEERTRKKAEKRKRKKQAAKAGNSNGAKQAKTGAGKGKGPSASSTSSSGGGSSSDGAAAEEDEFVYIPEADLATAGGDGGSGFKNDGSFLEMMKKELEKSESSDKPSASAAGTGKAVVAK